MGIEDIVVKVGDLEDEAIVDGRQGLAVVAHGECAVAWVKYSPA